MPNVNDRLVSCFSIVFPNLSREEIAQASNTSVATWDSLATVTLISVVEEEFGVTIMPEEYEHIVSFEFVRECVESKTAQA